MARRAMAVFLGLIAIVAAAPLSESLAAKCEILWFPQLIDHFTWTKGSSEATYQQRYYICSRETWGGDGSPIFFYVGNEGPVDLYVNHTGLMWENAAEFKALLIFAEHRYYGESQPYGNDSMDHIEFLTSEQALADYANLIFNLRQTLPAQKSPLISFGGSYGGMLSAYFRIKYPSVVDGAISSSAPVLAFPEQSPAWDSSSYYQVITHDASTAAGSHPLCEGNIRKVWPAIFNLGQTSAGLQKLTNLFRLCTPLRDATDVYTLAFWLRGAFDTLGMGSYPYPSSYLTGGDGMLPAWPFQVACSFLGENFGSDADLLTGMRLAVSVLYNVTADQSCYELSPNPYAHIDQAIDGIWDYQHCTELMPDSFWFATTGTSDMFWPSPYNMTFIIEHCRITWGVVPRQNWITVQYDLPRFREATNIVFSSGNMDPWSSAGVKNLAGANLTVIEIDKGGHHVDLFFSDPADPQSIRDARKIELAHIRDWVAAAQLRRQ